MYALAVNDVHKVFKETEAVKGVSFNVKQGEIFGLIGPNGAGKTTTLRMISTLLDISSGSITVYGRAPQGHHHIGDRLDLNGQIT